MVAFTWLYWRSGSIDAQTVLAIAIFAIALFFANLSDAFSSTFNAYEQMEYPATVASFMALARVALGALVLLIGWGFVGLAARQPADEHRAGDLAVPAACGNACLRPTHPR